MSSTIVCRSFMSCSDPQETTTTLKLKVTINENPNHQQASLLDKFENPNKHYSKPTMSNATKPYNSFTRLSPQSLELCTENLGSETGTETIFTADNNVQEPSNKFLTQHASTTEERSKLQKSPCERTVRSKKAFPPPLTTMSGSSSLKVTRHRENGRLIIEAVERPLRNGGVLQAERSGGRLRLCFLNSPVETGYAVEEYGGGEVVEEMNGPREGVDGHEVEEEVVGGVRDNKYHWMSRCKDGGHGGNNNRSDDHHWNKPSLWIVTS